LDVISADFSLHEPSSRSPWCSGPASRSRRMWILAITVVPRASPRSRQRPADDQPTPDPQPLPTNTSRPGWRRLTVSIAAPSSSGRPSVDHPPGL